MTNPDELEGEQCKLSIVLCTKLHAVNLSTYKAYVGMLAVVPSEPGPGRQKQREFWLYYNR